MSLKTKIRGFTSWVNLRLKPYEHLMNNVIMDLLTGTNMKFLLLSMTGRNLNKMDNFDNLSQNQKMTRVEWALDELKKSQVVPSDVYVDARMFAMRSASHMFELLWRMVCHDIWFVWERLEYLQHASDEVLCEVPFKWIPEPPPMKKKKVKKTQSLLTGFGASSVQTETIPDEKNEYDMAKHEPFPKADFMKKFKERKRNNGKFPPPDECIMEMVNSQLRARQAATRDTPEEFFFDEDKKTQHEGRKLHCLSIDDLVDSRVLCALMNSFIPNTFTTEVLLNDRWAINKVLRTIEKMFYMESPFDSEDLCEADTEGVCAYFSVFFMLAFKFRQSQAVCRYVEKMRRAQKDSEAELEKLGHSDAGRRAVLSNDIEQITKSLERLGKKFDLDFCFKWSDHVYDSVKELHKDIRKKIVERFDIINVPRHISINDLCLSNVINLTFTNGAGFYKAVDKEMLSDTRRLVLRDTVTGHFIDNFSAKDKEAVRKLLKLPLYQAVEVNPDLYPRFDLYFESLSRNKALKPGGQFLYQAFPNNMATWQKVFFKAIRDNELETVERMVMFFRNNNAFINCKEQQTANAPLHVACRAGHYTIVLHLLENGANIDQKNSYKQTPLFSAIEGLHKEIAHLLVEWGCDIHARGPRGQAAFETIKNDEFRDLMIKAYNHYSTVVPLVIEGDTDLLGDLLLDHMDGSRCFNNIRSRFINGSTILHTASYFGCVGVMHDVVKLGVDINLLDYKGATALHRARDTNTMKVLLDSGIKVSVEDNEGNTPLHVKCYGETKKVSEIEAIELLLAQGAKLVVRNSRGLLPIHCCAMQGRVDVIQLLLAADKDGQIKKALAEEKGATPPSLVHLAIANDYLNAAQWLLDKGFDTKDGELDLLLQRILSEQIKLDHQGDVVKFLLDHGATPNPHYIAGNSDIEFKDIELSGGESALHYAAAMSGGGGTEVLELLLAYGAEIDAANHDGATALFFACQCNNQSAASVLIDHGASVRIKNLQGLTAFDLIMDYEEWVECGYFTDEIRARLKAFNLKHSRDLVRAITKKVKAPHQFSSGQSFVNRPGAMIKAGRAPLAIKAAGGARGGMTQLPPLRRQQGQLTF